MPKLPKPEFKEEFGGFSVCFYKDIYTEEKLRKMGLNDRQIKAVKYVKERGRITNRGYQELNKCSRNTVTNDLRKLIQKGIIKESGKKDSGRKMGQGCELSWRVWEMGIGRMSGEDTGQDFEWLV